MRRALLNFMVTKVFSSLHVWGFFSTLLLYFLFVVMTLMMARCEAGGLLFCLGWTDVLV